MSTQQQTRTSPVEVHRNGGLAMLVGAVAAIVAIAWLGRAVATGGLLDWLLVVVVAGVAGVHLSAYLDARVPLLVADEHGVRARLGNRWHGLTWDALARVELHPRTAWWKDGRLVLVVRDEQDLLDDLDRRGRRQVALARRVLGAPLAMPLGLSTRVRGAGPDLAATLAGLTGGATSVLDLTPEPEPASEPGTAAAPRPAPAPEPAPARTSRDDVYDQDADADTDEIPVVTADLGPATAASTRAAVPTTASPTPRPLRSPRPGLRTEVTAYVHGSSALAADPVAHVADEPAPQPEPEPLPEAVEEQVVVPAPDPVIGPELARARERIGLSVDVLAERTRIRPHVIAGIEVDDFALCGGDFYARGHLRTLARVLGVDAAPLLETYAERYADAPIDPRRVFEAELASAGSAALRPTRGGPNFSVLATVVLVLVIVWSAAQIATAGRDGDAGTDQAGAVRGQLSGAVTSGTADVRLSAAGRSASVTVRDADDRVVWTGRLAGGATRTLAGVALPVRVSSSDGGVSVAVGDADAVRLGASGEAVQRSLGD